MTPPLVVRLPDGIAPDVSRRMFATTCGRSAGAQKVFVFVPGYQVVTSELTDAELASTFTPPLVALATLRIDGRLVDTAGAPMPNRNLDLVYELVELMHYCGYMDGPLSTVPIARVRTDNAGVFAFDVPAFHDDPFFQRYSRGNHGFRLTTSDGPDGGLRSWGDNLRPSSFAAERAYPAPFVVVQSQYGLLSGHLGAQFFRQNGLGSLGSYRLDLMTDGSKPLAVQLDAVVVDGSEHRGMRIIGYNAMLKADGSFERQLPPGRYDLTLTILGPDGVLQRKIPVATHVVIKEGLTHVVERP